METRNPTVTNFVLLDGMRGLGALLVLAGHTIAAWGPVWPASGAIVVDAFFALSGFVLAYAYEPKFRDGMGAGEFMLHRVVRLFPLYLLGTMLVYMTLMAFTVGDADGAKRADGITLQLLPQLVMLPSPPQLGGADVYSLNVPAYTLFCELAVNLVYVLIFRWLSTRVLIGVVLAAAVALAITILTFGRIDVGSDWGTWWGGLARAMFGFFLGVLAYRLAGSPRTANRPKHWFAVPMMVMLPAVCFIPATPEWRPFVDIALACGILLPILLVCQSFIPPDRFAALFTLGGQISYAVYILHQPMREILERIQWKSTIVSDLAPWSGMAVMALVVAIAFLAERYYDRPVRTAIVAWLKSRETKAAALRSATGRPIRRRLTVQRR